MDATEKEVKVKRRDLNRPHSQGLDTKDPNRNKLNEYQKMEICKLLAAFKSCREIAAYAMESWNIEMTFRAVLYYVHKQPWRGYIADFREKWTDGLADEVMSNKRKRLEFLKDTFDLAMNGYCIGVDKKGERIEVKNPAAAVQAIRQAQAEMEGQPGNKLHIDVSGAQGITILMPPEVSSPTEWMKLVKDYDEARKKLVVMKGHKQITDGTIIEAEVVKEDKYEMPILYDKDKDLPEEKL